MLHDKILSKTQLLELVQIHPTSLKIDREDVPDSLKPLIPYAEIWGLIDDGYREERFNQTTEALILHMRIIQSAFDKEFDEWLAGPEADEPNHYSNAYLAFSSWRMGLDGI